LDFIPNYNNQNKINNQKNQNKKIGDNVNEELIVEIEKLYKENTDLINENNLLKNKINSLTGEINSVKNQNENLRKELNSKAEDLNKTIEELNKLKAVLVIKKEEIDNLKTQMNNLRINNSIDNVKVDIKDIRTILFKSTDQKVEMPYSCRVSDIFVRIEEFLYNEYPEYKDLNTYFTVNGRQIKRFRTIQENKIKNLDVILLSVYE
jgi:seryl-tRNA synthetase